MLSSAYLTSLVDLVVVYKSLFEAYRDCGLLYRSVVARFDRDPMTVNKVWNRWVQEGYAEHCDRSQLSVITNSRDGRHFYLHGLNGLYSHVTSHE